MWYYIYTKEVYIYMTIGERIKARRQELGLTQRDLAKRMGYTDHTTITRAEAGKVDLPLSRVSQFAEALRVSPSYLMGWEDEDKKNPVTRDGMSEDQKKLMRFAETVPAEKAALLLKVMKSILEGD